MSAAPFHPHWRDLPFLLHHVVPWEAVVLLAGLTGALGLAWWLQPVGACVPTIAVLERTSPTAVACPVGQVATLRPLGGGDVALVCACDAPRRQP